MLGLYEILSNFDILQVSVATAVGVSSKDFIYSLVDDLLIPIILVLIGNRITLPKVYKYHGVSIPVGEILANFLRYGFLVLMIIVLLKYALAPISSTIIEMKNKSTNDGLNKLDKCLSTLKNLEVNINDVGKNIQKVEDSIKKVENEIKYDKTFHKYFGSDLVVR